MPATFPSHQGAILPLKLWRPRWFDGVALAAGAASPDVAYLFDGSGWPVWPLSHEPLGLLVGRLRLVRDWHGAPPEAPWRPVLFWSVAVCLGAAGAVVTPYLPAAHLAHTTGVRLIAVVAGALLLAAACTACVKRPRRAGWVRDRLSH